MSVANPACIAVVCVVGALLVQYFLPGVEAVSDSEDIGKYRDETFVELPYVYSGYLDSKLTPEVAIKVLVEPCKEYDAGCCATRYGVMEYFPDYQGAALYQVDRTCLYEGRSYPIECVVSNDGVLMSYQDQRVSDYDFFYNESCVGENEPDTKCVDVRVGRKRNSINPPCWDYNDTVDSRTATCRLEDGTTKSYCMEFAFATNAFVMECRGDFETDMTCGTYVELHKQGEELYYAQKKIPQGIYSGMNDIRTGIDLTLFGGLENETIDGSVLGTKVLCRGNYELWWVQRTRLRSYVLYKKHFEIIDPVCDWSLDTTTYQLFTAEKNLYVSGNV